MDFKALCNFALSERKLLTKTVRFMKATAILFFAACLQVSASSYGQTITLSVKNTPIEKVFEAVKKQTGYSFIYTRELLKNTSPVSLEVKNAALEEVLDNCVKGQPIAYFIENKFIIIKPGPNPVGASHDEVISPPGKITIHGTIHNETGQPLAGASVTVKGTDKGTSTNETGEFTLPDVDENAVLIISSIGHEKKEIPVKGQTSLSLTLKLVANPLEDMVVTGFQLPTAKKKIDIPITTITGEQLTKSAFNGVQDIFRGLVPDAVFLDRGPVLFTNSIALRGGTSTNGFNAVKTYIDGVPVSQPVETLGIIDINSIDHIEVTRGPSGSTLYGSNASGGVIQIFTKKGAGISGQSLNVNAAVGSINSKWVDKDPFQQKYNVDYQQNQKNVSFNFGGSYQYQGPWVPEYQDKKTSLYSGITITGSKTSNNLMLRYGKDTYTGGKYVILPRAGISAFAIDNNTTYSFPTFSVGDQFEYKPFPWWTHTINIGYDVMDYEFYSTKIRADSSFYTYSSIWQTTSARYTTAIRFPDMKSFRSTLLLGIEAVQDRNNYNYGKTAGLYGSYTTAVYSIIREKINSSGYFAQWQPEILNRVFLTAGIRAEKNDLFGQNYGTAYSPRLGGTTNFKLGDVTIKPRISWGVSIQAPSRTYKEGSISTTTVYLPNANIEPQKQKGIDAGINFFALNNKLEIGVTYFSQHIEGQIDRVLENQTGTVTTYQYQNVGKVDNSGLETELKYTDKNWTFTGNYSVLFNNKVKVLSPNYSGYLKVGDNLLGVPLISAGGSVSYLFQKLGHAGGLSTTVDATMYGNMTNVDYINYYKGVYGLQPSIGNQRAYWIKYPDLVKLNLSLQYSVTQRLKVYTQIRNLTNSYASENTNYTELQGRSFLLGVKCNFLK